MKRSSWVILAIGIIFVIGVLLRDDRLSDNSAGTVLSVRTSALSDDDLSILNEFIIPSFEDFYKCKVIIQSHGEAELATLCREQLAAGSIVTDVVIINTASSREWVQANLVSDLSSYVSSWNDRSFAPSVMNNVVSDSITPFLPLSIETAVLCYNRRALAYLPVGANPDSLTWEQTADWSLALAESDTAGRFAMEWSDATALTKRVGSMILGEDGNFPDVGTEPAIRTWKLLAKMRPAIIPADSTDNTVVGLMQIGEAWLTVANTESVRAILSRDAHEYGIAPAPRGSASIGTVGVIRGLGVIKGSPQNALAFHFVEHMTSCSIQAQLAYDMTSFTPVVDVEAVIGSDTAAQIILAGSASLWGGKVTDIPRYGDWPGVEQIYRDTFDSQVLSEGTVSVAVLKKANGAIAGMRRRRPGGGRSSQ